MTDAAEARTGVRTVFFGSGSFAVPILDALAQSPLTEILAVVSAPDRPVGRKAVITPTPIAARARELGLPVLTPARVRRPESVAEIEALEPELVVLADYGQLIPRVLLDLPPRGFLNLHPSLLPRHRRAAPIPATILAGDRESAVTLMVVSEEMDAGPVVATAPLTVTDSDTAVTLEERAARVAADLLVESLPAWLAGGLVPVDQPLAGVTLTRPLRREDGRIDVSRAAVEIERQIRAYQPWPGSYLELPEGRLIVWSAAVVDPRDDRLADDRSASATPAPGTFRIDRELFMATGSGELRLDEVQPAGKRRMTAAEYLRGHPQLREPAPAPFVR
jgi:methionyl-tRNA formyltransferase